MVQRLHVITAIFFLASCCAAGCMPGATTFGCLPGVRVVKNPDDCEEGIRYYRPKPYLLLTSGESEVTVGKDETTTVTHPDARFVNLKLEYLPDFEEEYAISVTPGFGTANVQITLEDGWNLTSLNQDLDSKVAENIQALAELAKVPAAYGAGFTDNQPNGAEARILACTNVPLGYYEAVLGRDHRGRRRMYGWRYVGFMPYAMCPTDGVGSDLHNCQSSMIYGLVFDGDVMVFKPLHEVAQRTEVKTYIETEFEEWEGPCPSPPIRPCPVMPPLPANASTGSARVTSEKEGLSANTNSLPAARAESLTNRPSYFPEQDQHSLTSGVFRLGRLSSKSS